MQVRWYGALVVLFTVGFGIAACGGGSGPAGANIAAAQDATTPEEPATTEAATPAPAAGDDDSARAEVGAGASSAGECTQVPRELSLAEQCAMAGAVVHTFGNTCVGKCRAMESGGMMMCGQAMTQGCKCPDGQCIDDRTGCCREVRE